MCSNWQGSKRKGAETVTTLLSVLRDVLGPRAKPEEPLARHTTLKVGGPAEVLCLVETDAEIEAIAAACKRLDLPLWFLGGGTNLVVGDEGVRGAVIQLSGPYKQNEWRDNTVVAGAGDHPVRLSKQALARGLLGLEFGAGIPGTLGGAVVMNAGTSLGELQDVLVDVTLFEPDGTVQTVPAAALGLGYRRSVLQQEQDRIVLRCTMRLKPGSPEEVAAAKARVREHLVWRRDRQPLELPNAGSVFKNPPGDYAGRLIEAVGLKGHRIGDAQFSERHANFVVNVGAARGADVHALLVLARERVLAAHGVALDPEVRFWPAVPEGLRS